MKLLGNAAVPGHGSDFLAPVPRRFVICHLSFVISACLLAPSSGADEAGDVLIPASQLVSPGQIDRYVTPLTHKSILQRVVNQNAFQVEIGVGKPVAMSKEVGRGFRVDELEPQTVRDLGRKNGGCLDRQVTSIRRVLSSVFCPVVPAMLFANPDSVRIGTESVD